MCLITLARRQSSSGASSDLAALQRRPRPPPISTVCLSKRRATTRTLCMLEVRVVEWRSMRPYRDK